MNGAEILEQIFQKALSNRKTRFPEKIERKVAVLVERIDKNKSVVSALVTSLLKKIQSPEQDVRLHRADFKGGYSARVLDTKITTPFFKTHFSRYANKESSFLTLATREKIKWTKRNGQALKIRDADFKSAFLEILDDVESENAAPDLVLECLFSHLITVSESERTILNAVANDLPSFSATLSIALVVEMLVEHFSMKKSSRLPVIAVFTIYQALLKIVRKYEGTTLLPLKSHTSSDRKGFGDIEIVDASSTAIEIVEVKHNIALDRYLILDVVKKSARSSIKRYYVLTTALPCFKSVDEEKAINDLTLKVKYETGLEVIANGIVQSLKYYLRFVDNLQAFINGYTENLIADLQSSTEVTIQHIQEWKTILERHHLSSNEP